MVADEQWLASLSRSEVLADRFVLIGGPCQSTAGGYNDSSALCRTLSSPITRMEFEHGRIVEDGTGYIELEYLGNYCRISFLCGVWRAIYRAVVVIVYSLCILFMSQLTPTNCREFELQFKSSHDSRAPMPALQYQLALMP